MLEDLKKPIPLALLALLLSVAGAWLSREHSFTKTLKAETKEHEAETARADKAETETKRLTEKYRTEMSLATQRNRVRTESRLPDGTINIRDEESESSLEQMRQEIEREANSHYAAWLSESKTKERELTQRVEELTVEVTKSAPRWALAGAYAPLAGMDQRWRFGGGMNLGALSIVGTLAPAAILAPLIKKEPLKDVGANVQPQVELLLRF